MQEMLVLQWLSPRERKLTLCWDQTKIEQFKKDRGLEDVEICFASHKKTLRGFLKRLLARGSKKTEKTAGMYKQTQTKRTVVLFLDTIAAASIKTAETSEQIKENLPKLTARILCHELGHATEKTDLQQITKEIMKDRRVYVPLLGIIWIKRGANKKRARSEKIAEEFADKYSRELEPLFTVKEM